MYIAQIFYKVCFLVAFCFVQLLKRNEKGETLLHVAAISGNLVAARQLILEVCTTLSYIL